MEFSDVAIFAIFRGSPVPEENDITWSLNGTNVNIVNNYFDSVTVESKLFITKVNCTQSGEIICSAQNQLSNGNNYTDSATINLYLESKYMIN